MLVFFIFEVTHELCYVYITPKYCYTVPKSFTYALQYVHLTLATLQSVATNNLALFDCLQNQ